MPDESQEMTAEERYLRDDAVQAAKALVKANVEWEALSPLSEAMSGVTRFWEEASKLQMDALSLLADSLNVSRLIAPFELASQAMIQSPSMAHLYAGLDLASLNQTASLAKMCAELDLSGLSPNASWAKVCAELDLAKLNRLANIDMSGLVRIYSDQHKQMSAVLESFADIAMGFQPGEVLERVLEEMEIWGDGDGPITTELAVDGQVQAAALDDVLEQMSEYESAEEKLTYLFERAKGDPSIRSLLMVIVIGIVTNFLSDGIKACFFAIVATCTSVATPYETKQELRKLDLPVSATSHLRLVDRDNAPLMKSFKPTRQKECLLMCGTPAVILSRGKKWAYVEVAHDGKQVFGWVKLKYLARVD